MMPYGDVRPLATLSIHLIELARGPQTSGTGRHKFFRLKRLRFQSAAQGGFRHLKCVQG